MAVAWRLSLAWIMATSIVGIAGVDEPVEPTFLGRSLLSWTAQLKDKDSQKRHLALLTFAWSEEAAQGAVSELMEAVLEENDDQVRSLACKTLFRLAGKVRPALIKALGERNPERRRQAAREMGAFALGKRDNHQVRLNRALVAALKDEDPEVRRQVTMTLWYAAVRGWHDLHPTAMAVLPLVGVLKDEDREVRHNAAEAQTDPAASTSCSSPIPMHFTSSREKNRSAGGTGTGFVPSNGWVLPFARRRRTSPSWMNP